MLTVKRKKKQKAKESTEGCHGLLVHVTRPPRFVNWHLCGGGINFTYLYDGQWYKLKQGTHQASQVALMVKNPPANAEDVGDVGSSLGGKDPQEVGMATHSSILA